MAQQLERGVRARLLRATGSSAVPSAAHVNNVPPRAAAVRSASSRDAAVAPLALRLLLLAALCCAANAQMRPGGGRQSARARGVAIGVGVAIIVLVVACCVGCCFRRRIRQCWATRFGQPQAVTLVMMTAAGGAAPAAYQQQQPWAGADAVAPRLQVSGAPPPRAGVLTGVVVVQEAMRAADGGPAK
jgi:hypothetical protein